LSSFSNSLTNVFEGFSDSLNLSVAAAMILQRIFLLAPEARGNLTELEKSEIRESWYEKLAKLVQITNTAQFVFARKVN
jgi:hypothetical protein